MKTQLLLLIMLLTTYVCNAQFQTQQFVDNIPSLPDELCKIKPETSEAFIAQVKTLKDQVHDQIKKMRSQSKVDGNQAKADAINQMASQYGLSDEEVQKMKSSKKMSAEEKAALADKMMMQQTNISTGEIKNMQGMSDEGKKAWAEAYSAEGMAIAQENQGNSSQQNAGSNLSAAQQLQNLNSQVQERRINIQKEYEKIENDPERMAMLQRINGWKSQITAMTGADGGQGHRMDSIGVLIVKESEKYCEKYTPLYAKVLNIHYADLKASYPDYLRIADLNRAVVNMQPVKVETPAGTEDDYLKYIDEYLSRLTGAFIYTLK